MSSPGPLRGVLMLPGEFQSDYKLKKKVYNYAKSQGLSNEEAVCLSFLVRNKMVLGVTYESGIEERIEKTKEALKLV